MNQNISLEQLIPNPKSLRLLILHTPFPLSLTPLQACENLIKLDVSNNNLGSVPYLGHLNHLQFLFLHNNKLDFDDLRRLFSEEPDNPNLPQSNLAKHIVWVTFWGNKNCFYARHYLVNHTSAIAVDQNLVVEEEKSPNIHQMVEPFSPSTQIPFPLLKLQTKPDGFTEEEFIASFYVQLSMLRKRHTEVNPFLIIQKVFRGRLVRLRLLKAENSKKEASQRLLLIFNEWKRQAKNNKQLHHIINQRNKAYLVGDIKLYKRQLINQKCVALAREAKVRAQEAQQKKRFEVRLRSTFLKSHYSFKLLWEHLELDHYRRMYILTSQEQLFANVILPFATRGRTIVTAQMQNKVFAVRLPLTTVSRIPYTNILGPWSRANLLIKNLKPISKKRFLLGVSVRPVVRLIHLSNQDRKRSNDIFDQLSRFQAIEANGLMVIEANEQLLKAVCRAVVLYNKGRIVPNRSEQALILPERTVHESSFILTVQKLWRGYVVRKSYRKQLLDNIGRSRAALRIQRWFRRLPFHHRKRFMAYSKAFLSQFIDSKVLFSMDNYLKLGEKAKRGRMRFIEQYAEVFTDTKSREVGLRWGKYPTGSIAKYVSINRLYQKPLFPTKFLNNIVGSPVVETENSVDCDIYSLLHVRTKTKIVYSNNQKFVSVEYQSVRQLRRKIFALTLLTYDFRGSHTNVALTSTHLDLARTSGSSFGQWKHSLVQNPNSLFLFSDGCRYFEQRAQSLHLDIVKQPVLIYVKEKKNSYPFKVQEIIKFVHHTNIDIHDFGSVQPLQTFLTDPSRQLAAKISISDLLIGAQLRKSEQDLPAMGNRAHENQGKSRAVTSHMTVARNIDRLVRRRKQPKFAKELHRTSIGDHLQTHYKTEESSLSVVRHLKSDNRMLKTETSQFQSAPKKITERPSKSVEEEIFTANFVSMSNFISKQSQINQIRLERKRMRSNLASVVTEHRERTQKSKQRVEHVLNSQARRIRQASREYKEDIASKLKDISVPRLPDPPKKKPPNKSKIHVVFPEQCFPLEPN